MMVRTTIMGLMLGLVVSCLSYNNPVNTSQSSSFTSLQEVPDSMLRKVNNRIQFWQNAVFKKDSSLHFSEQQRESIGCLIANKLQALDTINSNQTRADRKAIKQGLRSQFEAKINVQLTDKQRIARDSFLANRRKPKQ